MRKLLLLGLAAMLVIISHAQNSDKKWSIGVFGGKTEYNGDLGNAFIFKSKAFYPFGAISINRYLNPSFDVGIFSSFGEYGYHKTSARNFHGDKLDISGLFYYKLNNGYIFNENARIAPYIAAGAGWAHYAGNRVWNGRDLILPVGGGVKFNLSPSVALQYQLLYNFTNHDKRDHQPTNGHNDQFASHSIGFVFSFGKVKDQDRDGVKDKDDLCPTEPGPKALKGCPDRDGDGIADKDDRCPDQAGPAKFNGCPDTDGDGIPDIDDRCPDQAGPEALKGCPDKDGDGVPDIDDRCPDQPGPAKFNGCPDTDGDGIPDIDDRCPDQPGPASNNGCPEEKKMERQHGEFGQPTVIQFEVNKSVLKKTSRPTLQGVAKTVKDNNDYDVVIEGYTDVSGGDKINIPLSNARAKAVRDYLLKQGVAADRIKFEGKGSANPIADNKSKAGRVKNRRAEIRITY